MVKSTISIKNVYLPRNFFIFRMTPSPLKLPVDHYQIDLQEFFQFGMSIDCAVFGYDREGLKILLIKRGTEPFKDYWAIPGDLVYPKEDLEAAVQRVLKALTGISDLYMDQASTFGEVSRHPLGRVITVGYFALINIARYNLKASSWATNAKWVSINEIPNLAFDHDKIVESSLERIRKRMRIQPIGFNLLPKKFTLNDIQKLYEDLLGTQFDKANFRKKIQKMKLLQPLKELESNVAHRPAKLYKFNQRRYNSLINKGFNFEL